MSYAIGIDVGGTFTDLVAVDAYGLVTTAKAASTPDDPSIGVLDGLGLLAAALNHDLAGLLTETVRIVHGTTVATNALLEGKGAKVGLLTTAGHRDVIEMREGLKPNRYDLRMPREPAMVPRELRLGVRERMRADGRIETPLDIVSLDAALDVLVAARVDAIAIGFLHAWHNPVHEQRAAAAARARMPHAFVTASHEVLPQIKEFERFATTIANAMVGPVVSRYLARLQSRLGDAGFKAGLFIMLSHGGIAEVAEAIRLAAGTALSGPAGGVAALVALAQQGIGQDLIGFDMGGTSTDIALVQGGRPYLSSARGVGAARIALPSLDITTVGAGGGSIAHVARNGLLQVGPQSAGAQPGPACYGDGGTAPTVTDANLALGFLDPATFLGGRRQLHQGAADAALARLGAQIGIDITATAAGIHRLVNAGMADTLRVATVRRGIDPRRFALVAFGGAAGLHATAVAAALGMQRVLVPLHAAVLSAWGMLNTDLRSEMMRSLPQGEVMDSTALDKAFAAMRAEGAARLAWFDGALTTRRSVDMRYGEQVAEITVPVDNLPLTATALAEAFHATHEGLFTYALRDRAPVLVNARLSVIGTLPKLLAPAYVPTAGAPQPSRRIFLQSWREVPVHQFAGLGEDVIIGPALIVSDTTSVLLRDGDHARFDARGWLDISLTEHAA